MKIAGVVCEYNPFHNGHAYHLQQTRKEGATHIVAVMSACFVQRGTGAFCDPFARARAAVRCGADLVLELGVPYACASAGVFAFGAVETLTAFGVDLLSFGAETPNPALLRQAADALSDDALQSEIGKLCAQGIGYPAAAQTVLENACGTEISAVLKTPNNTLAVEYIKAAKKIGAPLSFLPVQRVGAAHDAALPAGRTVSAKALREMKNKTEILPFLPPAAAREIFAPQTLFFDEAAFETALLCTLRQQSAAQMERCIANDSALSSRLFAATKTATDLPSLLTAAQTKSVTAAKVRRAALHCFLNLDASWQRTRPPFLHVLAANERGLELLHAASPLLPLITKHRETAALSETAKAFYALQCRVTDVYTALCRPRGQAGLLQRHSMDVLRKER